MVLGQTNSTADFSPGDKSDVSDFAQPEDPVYVRDMIKRALNIPTTPRYPSNQLGPQEPRELTSGSYKSNDHDHVTYWIKTRAGQDCFVTLPKSDYLRKFERERDAQLIRQQEEESAKADKEVEQGRRTAEAYKKCIERSEKNASASPLDVDAKAQCELNAQYTAEVYYSKQATQSVVNINLGAREADIKPSLVCKAVGQTYLPSEDSDHNSEKPGSGSGPFVLPLPRADGAR